MLVIRCTAKLFKELAITKSRIYDFLQLDNFLGSWYANIVFISRKKCLLFVNEKTLFTFIIPGIKKSDLKNFKELFIENLSLNLNYIGVEQSVINRIRDLYDEFELGKTQNKSVLGSMVDYAKCYKYQIQFEDGHLIGNILEINSEMNEMPMGAIGYMNGKRMLQNLLRQSDYGTKFLDQ